MQADACVDHIILFVISLYQQHWICFENDIILDAFNCVLLGPYRVYCDCSIAWCGT